MKRFSGLAAFSMLVLALPVAASAQSIQTMTMSQLEAYLQSLLAEVQSLQQQLAAAQGGANTAWWHAFSTNLEVGNTGPEVQALQQALSKDGESVTVSGTFDEQTASAVTGFQEKYASLVLAPNGLQYGTGYVGRATRAELNTLFGCNGTSAPISSPTPMPNPTPVASSTTPPVACPAWGCGAPPTQPIGPPTTTNPGTLSISLDPNIPAQSQTVTPGGKGYVFVVADLTAGPSVDVTVTSINFGCGGFACNSSINLKMVSGSETWTGSPLNANLFTPNLVIPRGTTVPVELVGDVSPNAPLGQGIAWSLTSNLVNIVGGNPVTGGAFGSDLTVTGPGWSGTPSVTLQVNGSGGPITVSSGAPLNVVWNSTGASSPCSIAFNPTGAGTYGIGTGYSGTATANAPTASAPTAYQYVAVCNVPGMQTSVADSVQVNVVPGTTAQPTFTASPTSLLSGATPTFSWTNVPSGNNFFGTATCVSGITLYDVTNNQNFACGDVDRTVPGSGSDVIQITSANASTTQVPFVLQYGNGQSLSQTITVYPAIQPLAVTAAQLGVATGRAKSAVDNLAALTFRAATGWVALNKVTITFGGSLVTGASSTFLNTAQLLDQNNNDVVTADGATLAANAAAGTATWMFPAGNAGFMIPAYQSYTFLLRVNSAIVGGQAGVVQTLTAQIQNPSDVQFSTASQTGLSLPLSAVPIAVDSVSYAVGM